MSYLNFGDAGDDDEVLGDLGFLDDNEDLLNFGGDVADDAWDDEDDEYDEDEDEEDETESEADATDGVEDAAFGRDETYEEDADAADDALASEVTQDLSSAKVAQDAKPSAAKSVAMAIAGSLGAMCALGVAIFVARPLMELDRASESAPSQAQTQGQSENDGADETDDGTVSEISVDALADIVDTGSGYGVSKLVADRDSELVSLHGRIANLTDELHENVAMGIYLYDRDGSVIGVATGFVDRLEAGEVADYIATANIATADVYRLELVEVRW